MHPSVFALLAAHTLSRPAPRPSNRPSPAPRARLDADELYSQRERRRIANYLRLRLDELRRERLGRAVEVIERHLPVDALIVDPTPPAR